MRTSPVDPAAHTPAPATPTEAAGMERPLAPLVVDVGAHLRAAPDTVFAYVTDVPKLPEWMPLLSRAELDNTKATTPGGPGAVRVIYAPLKPPTLEVVLVLDVAARHYVYSATDASLMGMLRDHTGVIVCGDDGAGGTYFRWLAYANPGSFPMRYLGGPVFGGVLKRSVKNLQKRFGIA